VEEKTQLAEALADRYRIEPGIGSGGMATVYLRPFPFPDQTRVKVSEAGG